MLNEISYPILKVFEEHPFLSINDFRVILKNKVSIFEVSPYVIDFYKKGFLVPADFEKPTTDNGVSISLKLKLSVTGKHELLNYEKHLAETEKKDKYARRAFFISIASIIISALSLAFGIFSVFYK